MALPRHPAAFFSASSFWFAPKRGSHKAAARKTLDRDGAAARRDKEGGDFDRLLRTLRGKYPWLDAATVTRVARAYGTRAEVILGDARGARDLGVDFGAGLFQAEIDYLIGQEFALTAEDILWRRSKRGLHLSPAERARVSAYLVARGTNQRRKTAG